MKTGFLLNKVSWFGKYSGYECLVDYMSDFTKINLVEPVDTKVNRFFGKFLKINYDWNFVRSDEALAGFRFVKNISKQDASHILYLENHLHLFNSFDLKNKNLIGTIHQPFERWIESKLASLEKLDKCIILYKEEMELFNKYIDNSKFYFIPHGVDIDFFDISEIENTRNDKILIVGHYLRNFDMLERVILKIEKDISNKFEYNFIIPDFFRNSKALISLSKRNNVKFHSNLSDEQLLNFYQTSSLLLMPMEDSGANTAIVQAISTGLPVLTTDVGGIRSYGGGDVFPIVANNDDIHMVELFSKYYFDASFRQNIAKKQRQFALEYLNWNKVAAEHIKVYSSHL
ncbi:glycosyltransferase family 4 protein [Runella zeae]|uniref:glycosyltransferase family 4 protein n=1 Tax=Runella zeae TaxID=94255 RepID=UPI00048E2AEC|nr:glycosyltransferase family 4 protein [Runella zeae]